MWALWLTCIAGVSLRCRWRWRRQGCGYQSRLERLGHVGCVSTPLEAGCRACLKRRAAVERPCRGHLLLAVGTGGMCTCCHSVARLRDEPSGRSGKIGQCPGHA